MRQKRRATYPVRILEGLTGLMMMVSGVVLATYYTTLLPLPVAVMGCLLVVDALHDDSGYADLLAGVVLFLLGGLGISGLAVLVLAGLDVQWAFDLVVSVL